MRKEKKRKEKKRKEKKRKTFCTGFAVASALSKQCPPCGQDAASMGGRLIMREIPSFLYFTEHGAVAAQLGPKIW
jgi:hypothetical protein